MKSLHDSVQRLQDLEYALSVVNKRIDSIRLDGPEASKFFGVKSKLAYEYAETKRNFLNDLRCMYGEV